MTTLALANTLGTTTNNDHVLDAAEILNFQTLDSQPLYIDGILMEANRMLRRHDSANAIAERLNELGLRARYDVDDNNTLQGVNRIEDTNLVVYLSDGHSNCRYFSRTDIPQLRDYIDSQIIRLTQSWRRINDYRHLCNLENQANQQSL